MSDVYVYYVDDFPRGIHEAIMPGAEDDYSVYLDRNMSEKKRLEAYYHAVGHSEGDFEKEDVQEIESIAHRNP